MPIVHLERSTGPADGSGPEIRPDAPERGPWLTGRGRWARSRPGAERLLAGPGRLAAAARLCWTCTFTPGWPRSSVMRWAWIWWCWSWRPGGRRGRPGGGCGVLVSPRRCCGLTPISAPCAAFDGALGRDPVRLEAAHVRWRSQDGPDVVADGLALCALHHALFDLGVLGLTAELQIRVSSLYVARSDAGRPAVTISPASRCSRPGQVSRWSNWCTSAGITGRSSRGPASRPVDSRIRFRC